MTKIAICQPHYLPWIGYFEMIDRVDAFVLLDDVQYISREWKNRNRIRRTAEGADAKWLTVPVTKDSATRLIKDVRTSAHHDWAGYHRRSLQAVYGHTPRYAEVEAILDEGLSSPPPFLARLNESLVHAVCGYLGITTTIIRASELDTGGKKTAKLVSICERLGADSYLANNASAGYIEMSLFQSAGIALEYQNYDHPGYEQHGPGSPLPFLSHLSIVDLLCNHGAKGLDIIRSGRPS